MPIHNIFNVSLHLFLICQICSSHGSLQKYLWAACANFSAFLRELLLAFVLEMWIGVVFIPLDILFENFIISHVDQLLIGM